MEPKQVVIVSTPGRKLENLQNMLGSIDLPLNVETVDSCQAAFNVLLPEQAPVILIDYRYPDTEMGENIRDLILKSANTYVVLLQNRNAPKAHFTHYSTSEVVYDDLSVGLLKSLLRNTFTY